MKRIFATFFAAAAVAAAVNFPAFGDDLRNVKRGEPAPAFKLPTIDGSVADNESLKGSVAVLVFLSAEQRRSELASVDSALVVQELKSPDVKLVQVTADLVQKPYFERFRKERGITVPLAFDADRDFYGKLGLIVFPTTIILNKEGKLVDVISLHTGEYKLTLDAYIRHALGMLTDDQLKKKLTARPSDEGSPKSLASAHRALARSFRDKGQIDAAKAELIKAKEQDPENREVLLDLADLSILTADFDGADALVKQVLDAQPDHRRAKQLKGVSLYKRGNLDAAEAALKDALDLNPAPEQVHYYLGRICEQKGQQQQAMEHYREALRRFMHDTDAAPAGTK